MNLPWPFSERAAARLRRSFGRDPLPRVPDISLWNRYQHTSVCGRAIYGGNMGNARVARHTYQVGKRGWMRLRWKTAYDPRILENPSYAETPIPCRSDLHDWGAQNWPRFTTSITSSPSAIPKIFSRFRTFGFFAFGHFATFAGFCRVPPEASQTEAKAAKIGSKGGIAEGRRSEFGDWRLGDVGQDELWRDPRVLVAP